METTLDGLTVHYEEQGSGPLVVLLHGWGSNLTLFASIAAVMAKTYHVVSVDFPGCGGTSEPSEPWGMDEYTRFTATFIASFGEEDVIVLGHSHGGRVAIRLATDEDTGIHVSRLILVDSAGIIPTRTLGYHVRVKSYKAGKALLNWAPIRKAFPQALPALQTRLGSTDYSAASPVMRASMVKVVNADLQPLLPAISVETLLIWGADDDFTPLADGQLMEKLIPGAGLVTLENAGHYSFLDQPYAFARVLESFLGIK
ncbi:MAG: alpha/beta hydrolase [Propionibacteriaceae bacterium]|jgi:pimeloyl-ACP methyl ester carboxylesterase|nr:alpha/beta hydrolase [Propionibacteriaceae bacterium]